MDPLLVFVYMIPVSVCIHIWVAQNMESMSDMSVLSYVLHLLIITIILHMCVYEIL